MANLVTCGLMKDGSGLSEVVCNTESGEAILMGDINGTCVIGEVSVEDPQPMERAACEKILRDTRMDGVIVSKTQVILLRDGKATYRKFPDMNTVIAEVDYNLDVEISPEELGMLEDDYEEGEE